jgi:hypothetical protein
VAGHPLRPATRRRLGEPLPHQLADRPRGHPEAESISSTNHAIHRGYPVLAPVSRCYPGLRGRFLTCYSPVRHFPPGQARMIRSTCMLKGAPPAFVLSQDQTLHRDLDASRAGEPVDRRLRSESCRRGHCPPSGNDARWPPRGSHRAELNGDVSRDTPALAFGVTVPFSRSRCPTSDLGAVAPCLERRADTHRRRPP